MSGWPSTEQSGPILMPLPFPFSAPSQSATGVAAVPAAQITFARTDALSSGHDAVGVDALDFGLGLHLDAELLEVSAGVVLELGREAREQVRASLAEHDPGPRGLDPAEVAGQRRMGKFRDGACHFDPGRPATDHHEGQELADLVRVRSALGPFEGCE